MSEPISPFAFAPQEEQHLTHPHTRAQAQLNSRRRRSSSSDSERSASAMAVTASPMPKLFKVEIANNGDCKSSNPIFYPSDIIHGMVHLYLDKPMTLPALKIVFRGESNYPSSKQQDHLDHHMRRLFSVAMTLWGSREPLPQDQWGQLPIGNHIFPFTIQLPDKNLPASFDHPWLKNQYTLTAYYRRPNGLSKWQSKAKSINFMPLLTPGLEHGPIQESCPKMGTALLLSRPDLTPGGRVHVKMTAAAAIDRCHFSLSRHIRARINETTYKEDEVICHYERKSIPKGEFNLVLPIPRITPPTTESSSALKITYSVQVSIWNERFFFKTESHDFDFPIVIRTLPSCDNRECEGLDWCEPSVDRPMFLTEESIQPLPLYNADKSPPKYALDLPSYEQIVINCAAAMEDSDHVSTHSTETSCSDERMTPDHLHHSSCVYYVAPRDRSDQQHREPQSSSVSLLSTSSSNSSNNQNCSVSISSSSSQHSPDDNQAENSAQLLTHAQAVEYLKVHTTIESA
ncbi:hypothetical protein BGZ65_001794 [Modicella reniformis]|uniref:Arrestin-like N-terminal domain-containing protein n=1 Tax=Modicella reniformis TaxID=1440133 RepID=A0A9P6MBV8_9FUNG|nr:hypothetical protein BGZ65_001794 [Modicella reniformis]